MWLKPKSLEHYLSQEDPGLLSHLRAIGALPRLPYTLWFRRCFAGCLPESSLQRCAEAAAGSWAVFEWNEFTAGLSSQSLGQSDQRLL